MLHPRHHYGVAVFALIAAVWPAQAHMPRAVAVVDDVADRVMLFDRHTGDYLSDLVTDAGETDRLDAPFDCEPGSALTAGEKEYADTVLVSDLRHGAVLAYDATDGAFIKTLINGISVRGLAYAPDGSLLVAAGRSGVRAYEYGGSFIETRVAAELVDGPNNVWDVLVRPHANGGAGDMLLADPTLDVILQFDLEGERIGVFARLASFAFVEQLALRAAGGVLAVDVFANAVHEFTADGTWLRTIEVTRPRGVIELHSGNLLIASEEGVQVFDGETGELLDTKMAGYPTTAPRYVRYLGCRIPSPPGDMNGDGLLNAFDIDPFVVALADPTEYEAQYPNIDRRCAGDINDDGAFDAFDIGAFLEILTEPPG